MASDTQEKLENIKININELTGGASYVVRKTKGFTETVDIIEQLLSVISDQEHRITVLESNQGEL